MGWGAVIESAENVRKHRAYEMEREKWVERREDGEWLMVKCDNCGHPHARQRVLRVSETELRSWQLIEFGARKNDELPRLLLVMAIGIVLWAITWVTTDNPWFGLIPLVVVVVVYNHYMSRRDTRRENKDREQKQSILARNGYGDFPLESVGLNDQGYTLYVILPRE